MGEKNPKEFRAPTNIVWLELVSEWAKPRLQNLLLLCLHVIGIQ